nr:YetF domain-containing protein [uncultured Cellulosilyticum sp.]
MEIPFLLKPIILFIIAVALIRFTGRRSISQMTIAQTVMMISIGAIIVEPFADKDVIKTIIACIIFVVLLIIFELCSFYSKGFKRLAVGDKVVIIRNGIFVESELKKMRITKEEVLSRLRQEGIAKLSYVEEGTLETNGEFGFKLTKAAEPVRVEDMIYILNEVLSEEAKQKAIVKVEDFMRHHEER